MRYIGRLLVITALALAAFAPATAVAALAPSPAPAATVAEEEEVEVAPQQALPKPQLILIHGGSFLFEDPTFQPLTEGPALEAGFDPHYVDYPLGDVSAAVEAVRLEARKLRQQVGIAQVYAYGASAGGTLAAILAGEDDVAAAVAKAPITDLATWEWPLGQYGENYYETILAGPATRLRLSPVNRAEERPLLVIQGRQDMVVPPAMTEAFAAKFERVHLWLVPGGHTTERLRPWIITGAMRWLAQIAAREAPLAAEIEPLP